VHGATSGLPTEARFTKRPRFERGEVRPLGGRSELPWVFNGGCAGALPSRKPLTSLTVRSISECMAAGAGGCITCGRVAISENTSDW